MIDLPADQVHLWWTEVEDTMPPGHEQHCLQLMSPQERDQQGRFLFAQDRRRYLATRVLARTVLARYAPVAPEGWAFGATEFGRPWVANREPLAASLQFNISHSDRLVVMALSRHRALGVDTECLDRRAPIGIARSFFSAHEIDVLQRLSPEQQYLRFWELWTFKESYVKARGQGLSIPLDRFSIALPNDGTAQLQIDASLGDRADGWELWQLRPQAQQPHLVALCVESVKETRLQLVCRQMRLLRDERLQQPPITRRPHAARVLAMG